MNLDFQDISQIIKKRFSVDRHLGRCLLSSGERFSLKNLFGHSRGLQNRRGKYDLERQRSWEQHESMLPEFGAVTPMDCRIMISRCRTVLFAAFLFFLNLNKESIAKFTQELSCWSQTK
ncbi:hypothetical protein AVEN_63271-1 [Araneus ventricosus]|uniref:Uncharacterized protein n=1 Tax=Araneus ventricosus TaxID=182803 RepID=A0A4Y2K376_ARAVE|nr:hypothetical protein AVEN_63271-1 [Araneus ventricosus]